MDKKSIAKRINVSLATLYNWEKTKPELIQLIEQGIQYEKGNTKENPITEYFNELDKNEKEMYLAEIKARVLRKKLDK